MFLGTESHVALDRYVGPGYDTSPYGSSTQYPAFDTVGLNVFFFDTYQENQITSTNNVLVLQRERTNLIAFLLSL